MTTTEALREHRDYQRRLMASGIIPPRSVLDATVACGCGHSFVAGNVGVVRLADEVETLWLANCPDCHSTLTVGRKITPDPVTDYMTDRINETLAPIPSSDVLEQMVRDIEEESE